MLQGWRHKVVTCWNNLATSLIIINKVVATVKKLFQTCWQLETSSADTTCWRLVGRLARRCEFLACVGRKRRIFSRYVAMKYMPVLANFIAISKHSTTAWNLMITVRTFLRWFTDNFGYVLFWGIKSFRLGAICPRSSYWLLCCTSFLKQQKRPSQINIHKL